mgnify:CR=1 FL=1
MELIIKSFIISLAIVELRIFSSPGMILFFLRMPYDYFNDRSKVITYLLKPVIGCTTCMASVWTLVIDAFYFERLNKWTILTIFIVACLNSIIMALYERISK